ncbi:hypothetical protein C1637_05360 [Chryseobacterium lactis]|uniref:Lanthionine synthetase n=1 Tax=Chryseobacterium lactis TaxID=1241981 RepID=A0A3G6RI73_CHRLC|nr:lanthionine synthetase LanC family protein [Chryseobacterium lactis]AZA84273.1 hypothetical protein EG342_21330 [Chryseobacterium lactis]AZB04661.1 hypothetical protein EG341_12210 [Chryseobacterium lactis]PNW14392.1 hypothetical protein C1637_05360 [Chryseobacterium lactis]
MIYDNLLHTDIADIYKEKFLNFDFSTLNDDISLGKLNVANYFLVCYKHTKDEIYLDKIVELLEVIFTNLEHETKENLYKKSTFIDGLTGLAFTLKLLIAENILDAEDFEDQLNTIDEIILENSLEMIANNYFDYLGGPFGNLQYFLHWQATPEKADRIIQSLQKFNNSFYTICDNPYTQGYNLGLKHGYLGIIKTYIDYTLIFGENPVVRRGIENLLDYIIDNLNEDYIAENVHIYKYHSIHIKDDQFIKHQNNRLAWCNSDLTFAYYLLKAGKLLDNDKYIGLSQKIGLETTKRSPSTVTGVEDEHFCHGSSGLAFLYHKLHQLDPLDIYKEKCEEWKNKTLEFLEEAKDQEFAIRDLSLLYGKTGALVVLEGTYENSNYFEFLT